MTDGCAARQLGVRFYDPGLGRFTQLDPIDAEWSYYEYVDGNPRRYIN